MLLLHNFLPHLLEEISDGDPKARDRNVTLQEPTW